MWKHEQTAGIYEGVCHPGIIFHMLHKAGCQKETAFFLSFSVHDGASDYAVLLLQYQCQNRFSIYYPGNRFLSSFVTESRQEKCPQQARAGTEVILIEADDMWMLITEISVSEYFPFAAKLIHLSFIVRTLVSHRATRNDTLFHRVSFCGITTLTVTSFSCAGFGNRSSALVATCHLRHVI